MHKTKRPNIIVNVVAVVILAACLGIMTMPLVFGILSATVMIILFLWLVKDRYAVLVSALSFALCLSAIEGGLRLAGEGHQPQYFRPDETLIQQGEKKYDTHYLPNQQRLQFKMPYGDVAALTVDKAMREIIAEPRTVDFITDELGHRNRTGYRGEPYILFGDSLTVGAGTSQEAILSEDLARDYGISAYNAGFPGNMFDYVRKMQEMRHATPSVFRGVMLVFEGNDFDCDQDASRVHAQGSHWSTFVPAALQKLDVYRLFFGLTRRAAFAWGDSVSDLEVSVLQVGPKPMGFLNGYTDSTMRSTQCWHWVRIKAPLQEVAPLLQLIVFVPTSYRVYYRHIKPGGAPLPNSQADFLRQTSAEFGIPFIDLTSELIERSEELLTKNQYVWWRDDTHWNGEGIAVAAKAIARELKAK